VPDDKLETIIDACVRAANASNMQSYSIVVSREEAKIQKLTGYRGNCLLLYCADYNRLFDAARHLGHDFYADNIEAFITSSTNAILAAQTAVIAARSMGIDSLLTNGIHRGNTERLWDILELPQQGCFPLIALMLGYPRTSPLIGWAGCEALGWSTTSDTTDSPKRSSRNLCNNTTTRRWVLVSTTSGRRKAVSITWTGSTRIG